ncbi:hypothetical protein ACYB2S_00005 [Corynebacterium variabile]
MTTSAAPAAAFDAWALEAIQRGDLDTLANFRTLAPGMPALRGSECVDS